jgi:hypothetical protein
MSETTDKNPKTASSDDKSEKITKTNQKDRHIADLEQRLRRLEKRVKSNERFGKTLEDCLASQVVAADAVTAVVRRSLREDAELHDELRFAIKEYDSRKFSRWFTGFLGVLFRVTVVAVAAFMGAFIYWAFSGQ